MLPDVQIDCGKTRAANESLFDYEVTEGCGKYDLTIEQLTQKKLKKVHRDDLTHHLKSVFIRKDHLK